MTTENGLFLKTKYDILLENPAYAEPLATA
jgi:hypothetical protein